MGNENIQALLDEQAKLAKKIADAYGADAKHKQNMADFKAMVQRRKGQGARYMAAYYESKDDDIITALKNAGWVLESGDLKKGNSTWKKEGTSKKIVTDKGTWKCLNGTEIVAGPLPLSDLPGYLAKPQTQPSGKI